MSEQHTPGRLHVAGQDKVQIRSDKHQIAKAWSFAGKTGQENARRLVACWNLLAVVPTKEIEAAANYGSSWGKTGLELAALTAQRDELLEALKDALKEGIGWFDESCGGDADDLPWVIKARAAIAKVEGGGV